jgi:hypothetical protein
MLSVRRIPKLCVAAVKNNKEALAYIPPSLTKEVQELLDSGAEPDFPSFGQPCMPIAEPDILRFAGSAAAVQTGIAEVTKDGYRSLHISEDGTILWAWCGTKPNLCSVDMLDKEQFVGRCTCRSRKRPCKHSIGLLYLAHLQAPFEVGTIPEELQRSRKKEQKKAAP